MYCHICLLLMIRRPPSSPRSDTLLPDTTRCRSETVKPVTPAAAGRLHCLLFTPDRYRPSYPGSRFRRHDQGPEAADGLFYASETVATALAETAFYRFFFFALTALK